MLQRAQEEARLRARGVTDATAPGTGTNTPSGIGSPADPSHAERLKDASPRVKGDSDGKADHRNGMKRHDRDRSSSPDSKKRRRKRR